MNRLEVEGLGKRFFRNWLFRKLSFSLHSGESLLVTGHNGSGKSTLTRILSGQLIPDEGRCDFFISDRILPEQERYRVISWTGPYMELFTELSLAETLRLHFRFRKNLLGSEAAFIRLLELEKYADRPLKVLSSGMQARLKNALAVFSDSELLLLDEPTGNLDQENAERLFSWIASHQNNRMLIFVSNDSRDFPRFSRRLDLDSLK